jgi:hypothetical protein
MEKPARIRVTMPGLVLIDIDVKTLVLQMLVSDRMAGSYRVRYPITIETTAAGWTQNETIEELTDEDD